MPTSERGTSLLSDTPVEAAACARPNSVWAVILAAGRAQRMGRWKQWLPLEDGVPMLRRVCLTALDSGLAGVLVVIPPAHGVYARGADPEATAGREVFTADALADLPVRLHVNERALAGQSTSVHEAVLGLQQVRASAGLFLLGDQPALRASWVTAVAEQYRAKPSAVVQARYRGQWGHPVLFDGALFAELSACEGDEGGRAVILRYREQRCAVDIDAEPPLDLDTPQEYERYLRDHRGSVPGSDATGTP